MNRRLTFTSTKVVALPSRTYYVFTAVLALLFLPQHNFAKSSYFTNISPIIRYQQSSLFVQNVKATNSLFFEAKTSNLRSLGQTLPTPPANIDVDHWVKIGTDIDGKEPANQFGDSVSISSDGGTIAIGARFNGVSGRTAHAGAVLVFKRNIREDDNTVEWVQKGSQIDGEERGDYAGKSIDLSDDGSIIAVGSPKYGEIGKVRLYRYSNDTDSWEKMGDDISGMVDESKLGCILSLSGNGQILAVSGDMDETAEGRKMIVRIFKLADNNEWTERNAEKRIFAKHDECPTLSLSADGKMLAMGEGELINIDDSMAQIRKGRGVRTYKLLDEDDWHQLGQTIEAEEGKEMLGISVSLSEDGHTLAAGGEDIVTTYRLDEDKKTWKPFSTITYATTSIGSKENQESNGTFGRSVSLSGDGTRIVVGNPENLENGDMGAGIVQAFQLCEDGWSQLGSPIHGRAINGRFGFSVALSHDGESLIAGGPHRHENDAHHTGNVAHTGYASVYDLYVAPSISPSMTTTSPSSSPSASPSVNPTLHISMLPTREVSNIPTSTGNTPVKTSPTSSPSADELRTRSSTNTFLAMQATLGTLGGVLLAILFAIVIKRRKAYSIYRKATEENDSEFSDPSYEAFPIALPNTSD